MSRFRLVAVEVVAPFFAFLGLYIAGTLAIGALLEPLLGDRRMVLFAWASLGAAAIANLVCVALFDRFRLHLGILEPLATAARNVGIGAALAVALIAGTDLLILATTPFAHAPGAGLDWIEILALFLPAAVHEELVFRGYLLQKPARLNMTASVVVTSLLFALVHGGNPAVGSIALLNIFLAGILLALAWAWSRSLWVPISIHVVWNVASGPVLGHEVSGLSLPNTLLRTVDPGPVLLTGGPFGIEASLFLTAGELLIIGFLLWRITVLRSRPSPAPAPGAPATDAVYLAGSSGGAVPVTQSDIASTNETET